MTGVPPIFVPTAEGAEEVLRAARRRRRRQAAAAAGAVAAVIVGAGAMTLGGPSPTADRLDTTNGGIAHSHNSSAATPSQSPSSSAHIAASIAAHPLAPRTTLLAPRPGASPAAARPVDAVRPADRSPITTSKGTISSSDLCSDNSAYAAFGWCVRYVGPSTVRRGHVTTLSGELCRLASYPAASVSFASTREVDMRVLDSHSNTKWQAGQGINYKHPGRTTTVAGGSCIVWSSPWNTRGPDGLLVPPGDYSASVAIDSSSNNFPSVGTSIQVTD